MAALLTTKIADCAELCDERKENRKGTESNGHLLFIGAAGCPGSREVALSCVWGMRWSQKPRAEPREMRPYGRCFRALHKLLVFG